MSRDAALQTVEAREAFIADRRKAASERDARRLELAREFAQDGPLLHLPRERGFADFAPGRVPGAEAVVSATNDALDAIGHEKLVEKYTKPAKPFLARGVVGQKKLTLDSPYIRFALGTELVESISTYLGVVPVLSAFDVWYSLAQEDAPTASQLWHMDHNDISVVKVWVHCSDIGPESGPLTMLTADASAEFAGEIGHDMGAEYYLPDEALERYADRDELVQMIGSRGTVSLTDTCRCFHMGSRVSPGAEPRRVAVYTYLTPYAFHWEDHREQASFRHLADGVDDELHRLVLGAD
jgi:hypothetical protein